MRGTFYRRPPSTLLSPLPGRGGGRWPPSALRWRSAPGAARPSRPGNFLPLAAGGRGLRCAGASTPSVRHRGHAGSRVSSSTVAFLSISAFLCLSVSLFLTLILSLAHRTRSGSHCSFFILFLPVFLGMFPCACYSVSSVVSPSCRIFSFCFCLSLPVSLSLSYLSCLVLPNTTSSQIPRLLVQESTLRPTFWAPPGTEISRYGDLPNRGRKGRGDWKQRALVWAVVESRG